MNDLDQVIHDFIGDNPELFSYHWQRDDSPTDSEWDNISETWYDEYGEVADWQKVEDKVMDTATEYDWSTHIQMIKSDQQYVAGDFLFDSMREEE